MVTICNSEFCYKRCAIHNTHAFRTRMYNVARAFWHIIYMHVGIVHSSMLCAHMSCWHVMYDDISCMHVGILQMHADIGHVVHA